MKRTFAYTVSVALSLSIVPLAGAQSQGMGGMEMKGMEMKGMDSKKGAQTVTHKGTGTVRKFDPAGGKVTIAHEPIKSMQWPAMTMGFTAKDKKMLEEIKPGAKVEFEFVQQGKEYVITKIK